MNKFKKLVAVLVSVVMACVFATGVFATDYVDNLSTARAEVNGFLTQCGVHGMEGVVNGLNEVQLRALRDNSATLRSSLTQAVNALNNAKTETDVRTAVSTALSQVGGIFRDAGISLNIDVVVSGSEVAVVPTASANGVSGTTQWKLATDVRLLLLPTRSLLLLLQSSRLPVTTALWLLLPSFCLLLVSWVWLSVRRAHWQCEPHSMG